MLLSLATSFTALRLPLNPLLRVLSSTSTPSPPLTLAPLNLATASLSSLTALVTSLNQPKFRAVQLHDYIRKRGITDLNSMPQLPLSLRTLLLPLTTPSSLTVTIEKTSAKDSTIKRGYMLHDNQLIESVLMPYKDRTTACISSQAGCAMGCVFCATGQMGFSRQLTSEEIFEQVAVYDCMVKRGGDERGVTNVVFMGMGEPLANYRNVMAAVRRINTDLGIGARKITVSTVGLPPNIDKLAVEPLQVNLAVSLHESDDGKRSALLPANRRYGGLATLMESVRGYIDKTRRRVTFEWALIQGENDTVETARELGKLFKGYKIQPSMCHINVIPLNPTDGFGGKKSGTAAVNKFCSVLMDEFGISATPRMRRGIDIDAGCGQLKAEVVKKGGGQVFSGLVEPVLEEEEEKEDVAAAEVTTSIVDALMVEESEKMMKKLKKRLKAIAKLEEGGRELNEAQRVKVAQKEEIEQELEGLRHNLAA